MDCARLCGVARRARPPSRQRHAPFRRHLRRRRRERRASAGGAVARRRRRTTPPSATAARTRLSPSPRSAAQRIAALRDSSRVRQMPRGEPARAWTRLVPLVIEAAAQHADPDATLERMLHLLESISRREAYLALLLQYPQALDARRARWRAPARGRPTTWRAIRSCSTNCSTRARCTPRPTGPRLGARSCARQLDAGRATTRERQMDAAAPLQARADHAPARAGPRRRAAAREAVRPPERSRRPDPGARCCALAWRGCARATATSRSSPSSPTASSAARNSATPRDLDLDFPAPTTTRPRPPENYARLAQRMNTWLTSMTPAGVLYETDLRLRPDGASGLAGEPARGLRRLPAQQAWVWEHQALTRARFVAGDAAHRRRASKRSASRCCAAARPRARCAREMVGDAPDSMLDGAPQHERPLRHQARPRRHHRRRIHRAVPGARRTPTGTPNSPATSATSRCSSSPATLGLIDHGTGAARRTTPTGEFRQLQHALRLQGERYARVDARTVAREVGGGRHAVGDRCSALAAPAATPWLGLERPEQPVGRELALALDRSAARGPRTRSGSRSRRVGRASTRMPPAVASVDSRLATLTVLPHRS